MGRRIIHVLRRLNPYEWGGTETVVFETSLELMKRGYEFKIICPRIKGVPDKSTIYGIPVERFKYFYPYLGLKHEMRALMDRDAGPFLSFDALLKLLQEKNIDLIHSHTAGRLGGITLTAARLRRLPYVITIHGGITDLPLHVTERHRSYTAGTINWGKPFGMILGSRTIFTRADAIFCVGRREAELMQERYPSQRVLHLPNGVDLEFFARGKAAEFRKQYGIASDDQVILNVGRTMKQKNQRLLVEALPAVLQRCPKARLVLIGAVIDPAYRTDLIKEAARLGVDNRLTAIPGLPPHSQELADAYAACDLFIVPSSYETFGIVVLEAWASHKPVIASKVGGLEGFVEHEKDALLFNADDKDTLVKSTIRLLGDKQLCTRLAEAGYEKAKREYTWPRRCDKVEAAYNELIEASQK